ncbi:unnamed protein product [Zymoseptoria tritici ST99CH_3D7]|uniref:ATP synthase subunit 9, mitochondrial n=1 Tax=Zymoseptoria tritici (strain ST99CH_3D7) TaxID=1276538 RepID=A0A1X7S0M7_ZYMT9|nr:unnamed protein product [Zymoseptoria tritici ST99CH_3D7]
MFASHRVVARASSNTLLSKRLLTTSIATPSRLPSTLLAHSPLHFSPRHGLLLSETSPFTRPHALTRHALQKRGVVATTTTAAIVLAAKMQGAGLATIACGGAAIGVGNVYAALIAGVARNPSLRPQLVAYAMVGFALAESMGLFGLMVAFLMLYAY